MNASLSEMVRHCDDCAAPRAFVALCMDGHEDCLDRVCAECGAGYALLALPLIESEPAAHAPSALRSVA